MKLPFVSRDLHDAVVTELRLRLGALEAERALIEARYDKLLDLVTARPEVKAPAAPKDADPLTEVIRARAQHNPAIRRALGQYVKTARAQGVDENEILTHLTDWPSSDDEGVDG